MKCSKCGQDALPFEIASQEDVDKEIPACRHCGGELVDLQSASRRRFALAIFLIGFAAIGKLTLVRFESWIEERNERNYPSRTDYSYAHESNHVQIFSPGDFQAFDAMGYKVMSFGNAVNINAATMKGMKIYQMMSDGNRTIVYYQ